jgi:hypothetical protein
MKELSGTSRNYYLVETDDEGWKPHVELILIVSEPSYRLGPGELIRERISDHYRLSTNRKGVLGLIKTLMEVDKDLEKMESERDGKPPAVPVV